MLRFVALFTALAVVGLTSFVAHSQDKTADGKAAVLNFKMKTIDGKETDLSQYKGKVVLFVNVASKCGLTPQYKGLQALYAKYKDKGLVIIGVPANEFGGQEPGTDEEIAKFCSSKYDVTFPMLSKVVVKGEGQVPALHLPDLEGNQSQVRRRDPVELHQVPRRPSRRSRQPLRAQGRPRIDRDRQRHRGRTGQEVTMFDGRMGAVMAPA